MFELADMCNDLVDVQGGLVVKAKVMGNTVEAQEHLVAPHYVALCILYMWHGQHTCYQEHTEHIKVLAIDSGSLRHSKKDWVRKE